MTSREGGTERDGDLAPQAAQRLYTQRDMVLAQREAFQAGVRRYSQVRDGDGKVPEWLGSIRESADKYPLPKVTRPRVITDDYGVAWRWSENAMWARGGNEPDFRRAEYCHGTWIIDAQRVRIWADLFANPTETVDAEE